MSVHNQVPLMRRFCSATRGKPKEIMPTNREKANRHTEGQPTENAAQIRAVCYMMFANPSFRCFRLSSDKAILRLLTVQT